MATKTKTKKEPKPKKLKPGNANDAVIAPAQPATKTEQRKSQEERQEKFNELIRKNGRNMPSWSNYSDILAEVGLKPGDITPNMTAKADMAARKWLEQPDDRLLWLPPVEQDLIGQKIQVWQTKCLRYRVGRMPDSGEPRFIVAARINGKAANERVVANDLRSLRVAMEEAEKFHCEATKQTEVESNKDVVIAAAESNGKWHKLPPKLDPKTSVGSSDSTKPAKPTTEKKPHKTPDNKTKEEVARDRFNCREGSQAAVINVKLSEEPKTMKEIAEACGLGTGRVSGHLKSLVEKGFVVEKDKKFRVK